jgi:hypothetical protein
MHAMLLQAGRKGKQNSVILRSANSIAVGRIPPINITLISLPLLFKIFSFGFIIEL